MEPDTNLKLKEALAFFDRGCKSVDEKIPYGFFTAKQLADARVPRISVVHMRARLNELVARELAEVRSVKIGRHHVRVFRILPN